MFSALSPTTDIKATYVSLVPIGRLVTLDHRSGLFVLKKLEFLRANEQHLLSPRQWTVGWEIRTSDVMEFTSWELRPLLRQKRTFPQAQLLTHGDLSP